MNLKSIFSPSKRKKVQQKLLEHLSKEDSTLDAEQLTGGAQPGSPDSPEIGWLRSESTKDLK